MCRLYALPAALKGEAVNLKTMMEMWDVESTLSMVFFTLFVLFSLIQIAPIQINPWDAILGWIGDKLNGGIQKEFRAVWVDFHRQAILNFCRECRQDVQHSKEEWHYILDVIAKYSKYCDTHKIINGVIEEDSRFIRELYQELCKQNKI